MTQFLLGYTDSRGERTTRKVVPIGVRWGSSGEDSEEQWLLEATDLARGCTRCFRVQDITSLTPIFKHKRPIEWLFQSQGEMNAPFGSV